MPSEVAARSATGNGSAVRQARRAGLQMPCGGKGLGVLSLTLRRTGRARVRDALITIRVAVVSRISLASRTSETRGSRPAGPPQLNSSWPCAGGTMAADEEEPDTSPAKRRAGVPVSVGAGQWHVHEAVGGSKSRQQWPQHEVVAQLVPCSPSFRVFPMPRHAVSLCCPSCITPAYNGSTAPRTLR